MLQVIHGQEIAMTKQCEEKDYTLEPEAAQEEYELLLFVQPVFAAERALHPHVFERNSPSHLLYIFVRTFTALWTILNFIDIPDNFGGNRVLFWADKYKLDCANVQKARTALQHSTPSSFMGRTKEGFPMSPDFEG